MVLTSLLPVRPKTAVEAHRLTLRVLDELMDAVPTRETNVGLRLWDGTMWPDEAPRLADRIAAEHLEIATADPDALAARIRNAGAIFLGRYTPEVIGDYVAGSNHVLPTARAARKSSACISATAPDRP